jgi:hypothetical protein
METGGGMPHEVAATLPKTVGKEALLEYGQQVVAALSEAIGSSMVIDSDVQGCSNYIARK